MHDETVRGTADGGGAADADGSDHGDGSDSDEDGAGDDCDDSDNADRNEQPGVRADDDGSKCRSVSLYTLCVGKAL